VAFKPDILIGRRLDPRLVIDLKWAPAMRLHHGRKRLQNEHLYQLATYCTALGSDGLLVYPLMDDKVDSTYEFDGRKLSLRTIDLGRPGRRAQTLLGAARPVHDRVAAQSLLERALDPTIRRAPAASVPTDGSLPEAPGSSRRVRACSAMAGRRDRPAGQAGRSVPQP